MSPQVDHGQQIYAEQVALLYRNATAGYLVSVAGGALLVFALSAQVELALLVGWYGLLIVVTLLRSTLSWHYEHASDRLTHAALWERRFVIGTTASGLVWGAAAVVLFPTDSLAHGLFLAMVLAGMVAGAVGLFAVRMPVFVSFALPIVLTTATQFFLAGGELRTIMGVLTLLFALSMSLVARNASRTLRSALALRFDNEALVAEIRQRKRVEEALRASEQRFRDFADVAADWFWEMDSSQRLTYVSERFENICGVSREQVLGERLEKVLREHATQSHEWRLCEQALKARRRFEGLEFHWRHPGGTQRIVSLTGKPVLDELGRYRGYRGVGQDVTGEHHITRLITHQANHDALTGLVNRREFLRRLNNALAHSKLEGTHYVLCYLDLDRFKIINDTAGHMAGDELLQRVTGLFTGQIRARDTLSRFGGDEFALLLENCPLERAIRIAENLLAALRDYRFTWEGRTFSVGASIGVVPIGPQTETAAQALAQADLACYTAKDLGRGRVYVQHPQNTELERVQSDMLRVGELREALREDRFQLHCQPIFALAETPQISHYELLLRLEHPSGELMLPGAFIPAAERFGLMKDIDRWVVDAVLHAQREDLVGDSEATLFINLSTASLDDDSLLEHLHRELDARDLPAGRIGFEISEGAALRGVGRASRFISDLKQRGCRFALDHFGSGLSSFNHLKHLPVDYLKIDGHVIQDMERDAASAAMVVAINELGHAMGIATVAESVDNMGALDHLRQMQVDFAQGYILARPTPLSRLRPMASAAPRATPGV